MYIKLYFEEASPLPGIALSQECPSWYASPLPSPCSAESLWLQVYLIKKWGRERLCWSFQFMYNLNSRYHSRQACWRLPALLHQRLWLRGLLHRRPVRPLHRGRPWRRVQHTQGWAHCQQACWRLPALLHQRLWLCGLLHRGPVRPLHRGRPWRQVQHTKIGLCVILPSTNCRQPYCLCHTAVGTHHSRDY